MFFNPSSGVKISPSELSALDQSASDAGLEVVHVTRDLDCSSLIRDRLREGCRLFVAAGGDGTINTVIQPLVNTDAILGVIPVGTYNHFAKDLGIPLAWRDALDVVVNGEIKPIDTARINDRFFVNNVSMGLYPELVARREEKGRDYPRWKARLYAAYATLQKYPHVAVTLDTDNHHEVIRTHVLMISNNSYDLSRIGIEAPRRALEEGRLSVYWLPHVPRLALTSFVAHYLAGRVREAPGFRSFLTSRIKIQSSKHHLHLGIDGEVATMNTPLVITIVPQSLSAKVPRNA
ncbi:MAG TPA: diacylglycerol kinase family protein [Thermoanaerobaculia bacterium]|jgi:YegS/Rv2252/BmrU family lipid kinase|nr:diacylglycerol kinase family protein [Thermoanaerobaculia bacterium]